MTSASGSIESAENAKQALSSVAREASFGTNARPAAMPTAMCPMLATRGTIARQSTRAALACDAVSEGPARRRQRQAGERVGLELVRTAVAVHVGPQVARADRGAGDVAVRRQRAGEVSLAADGELQVRLAAA